LIDWLIGWLCFASHSRIFHLHGNTTIAGEVLQNLDVCSAHRAFEQGGIFIVPHLLWHGTAVFLGLIRITTPSSRLVWSTRGCEGSILTSSSRVPIQSPPTTLWGPIRTRIDRGFKFT
jgi:hypothetical protein